MRRGAECQRVHVGCATGVRERPTTHLGSSGSLARRHRNTEDGVGTEGALIRGTVELVHELVELGLVDWVDLGFDDLWCNHIVDVGERLGHPLAVPVGLVPIAELESLGLLHEQVQQVVPCQCQLEESRNPVRGRETTRRTSTDARSAVRCDGQRQRQSAARTCTYSSGCARRDRSPEGALGGGQVDLDSRVASAAVEPYVVSGGGGGRFGMHADVRGG